MIEPMSYHPVEAYYLEKSGKTARYPGGKVPVIQVQKPVELGKLTAHRFLAWCLANPRGLISLPTGKTPEFFIRELARVKEAWGTPALSEELFHFGIESFLPMFADVFRLIDFVQLDELFPVPSTWRGSFTYFVQTYYEPLFEFRPDQLHLMDMTPFCHSQESQTQSGAFCERLESWLMAATQGEKRPWFLLGGIGEQDGHFAFNMPRTSLEAPIHLAILDYPTRAVTSVSFGGIANVTNKAVTLGLGSMIRGLAANPNSLAILFAAGETKASFIQKVIEDPITTHPECPAQFLQNVREARVYVVKNAASKLQARIREEIIKNGHKLLIYQAMIDTSLACNKPIMDLDSSDLAGHSLGQAVLDGGNSLAYWQTQVTDRLLDSLKAGLRLLDHHGVWLETGPHHDDPELSHSALYGQLVLKTHAFAFSTSGFTSVSRSFMLERLAGISEAFLSKNSQEIFVLPLETLYETFKIAFLSYDEATLGRLEILFFVRALVQSHDLLDLSSLQKYCQFYRDIYFVDQIPGERDSKEVQVWKGLVRELESERLLSVVGVSSAHVHQLRARFYEGKIFNSQPNEEDISDMLALFQQYQPDVLTVTFDPEGSGPDTHFKTLQTFVAALRQWGRAVKILSYRNVWSRFSPHQVTCMVPVLRDEMEKADRLFKVCHKSQVQAEFPSPSFDGPFSDQVKKLQAEQLGMIKTLLGKDALKSLGSDRLNKAEGLIFFIEEDTPVFLDRVKDVTMRVVGDMKDSGSF